MSQPVPQIARHLPRGSTIAAARQARNRLAASVDNIPSRSDIINNTAGMTSLAFTADQAVGIGATVTLTWDQMVFDTNDWWSAGSPTRITVDSVGYYMILCRLQFDAFATTNILKIIVNGLSPSTNPGARSSSGGSFSTLECVAFLSLTGGDYIETQVINGGASPTNVIGKFGDFPGSEFTVSRLG